MSNFSLKVVQALANNLAARPSLRDFDLSRNKSLRALGIPASSIAAQAPVAGPPNTVSFLEHLLSTITSSAFSKIIVLYSDCDFRDLGCWDSTSLQYRDLSQAERAVEASWYRGRLAILRKINNVSDFQLELRASLRGSVGEVPVRILEEVIAEGEVFDNFFSGPRSVIYDPRGSPPDF